MSGQKRDYARANLELNDREIRARKIRLESTPVEVNLATTSRCQVRPPCVMCLRNKEYDPMDLSETALLRCGYILDSASSITLHGIGEPLLYKNLFDLARVTSSDAWKLFTTNGLLLGEYAKEVCELITKISVSIDAADEETYWRIRHNDISRIKDGIRKVVELKGSSETPQIDISMCLMQSNVVEAADFVQMGHDLGVDTVHFYHMNHGPEYKWQADWFDYESEHCDLNPKLHDKEILKALDLARELNVAVIFDGRALFRSEINFEFAENISAPPVPENRPFCVMPWRNAQINTDGTVMNCCYQTWAPGSLEYETFQDIWNGDRQIAIRQGIVSGRLAECCENATCPPKGRI